ncbi:NAD(P)H-dependent oxidoreductase [Paenibacillus sepulcri]|uniref:NAD(P)H-dependent oxidoreductase n=1 Tax=Paenibacillus sepulcri TaxID=359917 RepID=A0ABS7BVH2_9BACL|nr:NAD(P)H-dependent oxidoreductase [Paenibacillus sepulcri]
MNTNTTKKEVLDAYHFRHAAKTFDPTKKIPEEDFRFILETGRLSPSSNGLEAWKFLVVQNPELREELRPFAYGAYNQLPTASHMVVILARKGLVPESPYIFDQLTKVKKYPAEKVRNNVGAWHDFFDSFHLDNEQARTAWAAKQTYIALGNMMTSAAMIGVDSCAIEGFLPDRINEIFAKQGLLGDDEYEVSVMVAFGYRAKEPHDKTRRTMEQVSEWIL